jgi:hypothetical protein
MTDQFDRTGGLDDLNVMVGMKVAMDKEVPRKERHPNHLFAVFTAAGNDYFW